MRNGTAAKGLILLTIGGISMLFGILTATSETTMTQEDIFDDSHLYDYLDNHEYKTTAYLIQGTYELNYSFSSTETIREFYVSVLDPDGFEVISVYGPPVVHQSHNTQLTFEPQKTGQHTFILGGRWISFQANLYKLTPSTRTVYPYEITLYVAFLLLTCGVIVSIYADLKEKPTYWLDKL